MLNSYLKRIHEVAKTGDATEESYYFSLAKLLAEFADSIGKKRISITTLPKKTEAGNLDFRIWDGKQSIIGYVEAKAATLLFTSTRPFWRNMTLQRENSEVFTIRQKR